MKKKQKKKQGKIRASYSIVNMSHNFVDFRFGFIH